MSKMRIRSLPLADWPEADRSAWTRACQRGTRFRRGAASGFSEAWRNDLCQRYGYYLDHLARTGRLAPCKATADLVTPEPIGSFVAELQGRVRSVTTERTIYKVRRAAELMAPGRDFTWLRDIQRDLELIAQPIDKSHRVVLTQRLVEAGLTLIAQAKISQTLSRVEAALMTRNGLMVAMLGLSPVRLSNFAHLEIGRTFRKHAGTWWIVLPKTKSSRADYRPLPKYLSLAIESYLMDYRAYLVSKAKTLAQDAGQSGDVDDCKTPTGALWVNRMGRPLSQAQVGRSLTETTRSTLGISISPHLFRSCGATTAAMHAHRMPHLASALLHHVDPPTTESHYIRATSLAAGAMLAKLVNEL